MIRTSAAAAMACLMLACSGESTPQDTTAATATATSATGTTATGTSDACTAPLVRLQTSFDESCTGGNEHLWPLGMDPEDCHGWGGGDSAGELHQNSAKDIRCNPDGTFQFTQYAGNLTCQGDGVTKVYALDVCEQDIPPSLYTVATDLSCCLDPEGPDCVTAVPSVSVPGGTIYLNGEPCEP